MAMDGLRKRDDPLFAQTTGHGWQGSMIGMLLLAERIGQRKAGTKANGGVLVESGLTARESEVAELVATGQTNREIAEMLVISEGTAEVHVKHILNKLGFRSRAQIAAWVAERGGLPRPEPERKVRKSGA